jgi:5-amino-6-(5-phospho-D-ribitylamino)uracil phosphatase
VPSRGSVEIVNVNQPATTPVRVLALDVDHTILNTQRHIPAAVMTAIRQVRDAGAVVVLASGRGPGAIRTVVRELGSSGELAICYGGAWIGDIGTENGDSRPRFQEHRVAVPVALDAMAAARSRGIDIGWYVDETVHLEAPSRFFSRELAQTGEGFRYSDPTTLPAPHKLLAVRHRDQDVSCLTSLIGELAGRCEATFIFDWLVEIWPRGVSKATGLLAFCRAIGVGLDAVAAIGDSENDLEMIREVGLGIAMGNGIPAVKKAARWVTGSNDEAGVATAIERLFAEGLIAPSDPTAMPML